MASLVHLHTLLTRAARLLDQAAGDFAELGMRPERNIQEIGRILVAIYDLQKDIHERRPSLIPTYLKGTKYAKKIAQSKSRRQTTRSVGASTKTKTKPRTTKG